MFALDSLVFPLWAKLVVGVALTILVLGLLALIALAFRPKRQPRTHGSARWASPHEIKPLRTGDGPLIGRDRAGALLRYPGDAHLVTVAPTRSGKGVGSLIPNLLTTNCPFVCVDPKGENCRAFMHGRAGADAHVLDPFGATGRTSAACNLLDLLDPASPDFAGDAMLVAEAIVAGDERAGEAESHFADHARTLLAGLIMHCAANEHSENRNLPRVRDYATSGPEVWAAFLEDMSADPDRRIARAANQMRGRSDREASAILSTLQRHTAFLDDERMRAVLVRSSLPLATLRTGSLEGFGLFLVLPPDRMAAHAGWLRLMLSLSMHLVAKRPAPPPSPVLFLLDEFAALGRMPLVERSMGLMAGYGMQLWLFLQDLAQLKRLYGEGAASYLANAGVLQVFNVADPDTAETVSAMLGDKTEVYRTRSTGRDRAVTVSEHRSARRLLTAAEVMRMPKGEQLLFLRDRPPIRARKLDYLRDREFAQARAGGREAA